MKTKICAVFGHSKIEETEELKEKIKDTLINLIENKEVGFFYFGGLGQFDDLCWQIVTELKKTYAHIKRIYCLENEKYLWPSKRPSYLKNEDYEEFIYLPLTFNYWYTKIYYRNCEMINISDYSLFYIRNTSSNSGAYKVFQYATKNKKEILNV